MVRSFKILLVIVVAAALSSCVKKKAAEIPVSEFFKIPEKTAFKISPDGKFISYLKKYNGKQNICIQAIEDEENMMATSFSDFSVRGDYTWTYDDQILFTQEKPGDEHPMMALDLNTQKTRVLLSEGKASIRILNKNRQTPDIITISLNKRDSANFDVYRLNIKSGELQTYLVNPGNITEWLVDADANIRLIKATDGVDETILYRPNDKAKFKPIIRNNFRNYVRPIAFSGIAQNFYALSNVGRDKTAFVEINAVTGQETRVIYADKNTDIQRVDYSKGKSRLELVAWDDAKPKKHFFDPEIKEVYQTIYKQLSGYEVNITDRDSAERKFIVQSYTDRNRGSVYLFDRINNKLTKLADYSGIDPNALCEKKAISYTASDGTLINGYLTLPHTDQQTNLPVVVIPHDGPFGMRDSWNYSSEVQFLANRGYAVFQVNYRGSSGYGKVFYSAGFKEVGGKIQQDITDGVNWLIANKIANPKKIAIYGRGFGGFSALYAITFNPKMYNCAIVQNGLINLFTYIKTAPAYYKPILQKMYATIGDPEKDADLLRSISPVFHPEKPTVPLLFFQDYKDQRANISEVNHYIRELQKHNPAVKYSLNKYERGSQGGENRRMQNYADIEKFLDANMHVKP
ncbi:S9 family peptidase [Mucilaginibacter corticis]|uniref:S9 family peptidase n=1 Tax=Mucilaginibacter corticis TaxID=2597670 RepID=A0A556MS83_9SPHI|nr:prolyl oligopeptidase family serine peptidase [Mucilaginibacter corticis]TSJ42773.1 S9 family peptidase [Mucilaginibacter corticis]